MNRAMREKSTTQGLIFKEEPAHAYTIVPHRYRCVPGAISSVPFWCALMVHTTCSCACTPPPPSPLFHRDPPSAAALAFATLVASRTSMSTAAMTYITCRTSRYRHRHGSAFACVYLRKRSILFCVRKTIQARAIDGKSPGVSLSTVREWEREATQHTE